MVNPSHNQTNQNQPQKSSKLKNPVVWVLIIIVISINLIPDGIDIILNLINLSFIGLAITAPIVWSVNFSVGFVTFLILLIIGSLNFRSLAKKIVTYSLGILGEFIPYLNSLPLRTLSVILAIILTFAEEKFTEVKEKLGEKQNKINKNEQA